MNKVDWFFGGVILMGAVAYVMDGSAAVPPTILNTLFFVGGPLSFKGATDRYVMAASPDEKFDNFLVVRKSPDCPAGKHATIDILHEGKKIVISCFPGDEVP